MAMASGACFSRRSGHESYLYVTALKWSGGDFTSTAHISITHLCEIGGRSAVVSSMLKKEVNGRLSTVARRVHAR